MTSEQDRIDQETREAVRQRLAGGGAQRHIARQLGVSREVALAAALGLPVTRGSLAIIRERLRAVYAKYETPTGIQVPARVWLVRA